MPIEANTSEQLLAQRLRHHEKEAMQQFYALYAGRMQAVCSRYISDRDDQQDVLQETLIKVFTRIDDFQFRGNGSLRAWATRILINEALSLLMKKKQLRKVLIEGDIGDEPEDDDPPIDDMPAEVVHQMVSQLPTGYRTVFNLYVFEQKSHREIAQLLGISEKTSSSQLCKAKNQLARMINQYRTQKPPR